MIYHVRLIHGAEVRGRSAKRKDKNMPHPIRPILSLLVFALILSCALSASAQEMSPIKSGGPSGFGRIMVDLEETFVQMMPGETYLLTATVLPPNTTDGAYAWNNWKPEVAVIDPSGRITALSAGKTEIYAYTMADGRRSRNTCTVNVSERQPKYRALLIGNETRQKDRATSASKVR